MRYEAPTTSRDAAAILAKSKETAFVLGGGTDVLVKMRTGLIEPDRLVDIKAIPAMKEIKVSEKGFVIGAAVSGAELGEHKLLRKHLPGLVEAANLIGSDQIQGRCTLAGNLCNASPAADSVPAMIAVGAKVNIVGVNGRRKLPVEKVVLGPGKTVLKKGEIIESIAVPKPGLRSGDAYLRFIPRTEMDIAVVGVGISLTLEKGLIKKARVALGAVAPTPLLVGGAARAIIGTKLDDVAIEKLAKSCREACNPIDDKRGTIEYRTRIAGVLARRTALIAFERAGGKR